MVSQHSQLPLEQRTGRVAESLRQSFLHQSFGIIRFWGFAVVRPNDQSYQLTAVHQDGQRLDLTLIQEPGQGKGAVLSIWEPDDFQAITESGRTGVVLLNAARIRYGDREAWLDDDQYRIRTPRGEGGFAVGDSPALTLAR